MEGKDNIKELFSQKLGNYEANVNPELWANISTQVAAAGTATSVTSGLSVFAKVTIGLGISAAAIATVAVLSSSPEEKETPAREVQKEVMSQQLSNLEKVDETEDSEDIRIRESNSDTANPVDVTTATAVPKENPTGISLVTEEANNRTSEQLEIPIMSTKGISKVSKASTEPKIVEGIPHSDVTNYSTNNVVNEEEWTNEEGATPKTEVIKRYVNVFTPNGDGKNDYFELESYNLKDFSVVIFNPSGDIVFQSKDASFRWDGRDMRTGELVKSGNYMYMVSSYDTEGNPHPIYERLTIVAN